MQQRLPVLKNYYTAIILTVSDIYDNALLLIDQFGTLEGADVKRRVATHHFPQVHRNEGNNSFQ